MRSSSWIFRLGCLLHEEGILLGGDSIADGIQRRGPSLSASPWGSEGSGSPHPSSPTISASVTSISASMSSSSSCSWEISSSWWASSSCILQSSMRFLYLTMDLSIMMREVCRELNLCSISRLDGASVITCMASDMASNSICRLVCHLLHFRREEAASVHFFSTCLWFSLRTCMTMSSNCSSQAVPGLRK